MTIERQRQLAGLAPSRPDLAEGKPKKSWVKQQLAYWKAELKRRPKDKSTRREYQSLAMMARQMGLQAESIEEVLEQITSANVGDYDYPWGPHPMRRQLRKAAKAALKGKTSKDTDRILGLIDEKAQPHLNKYDPGSLLGWTVFLLEKHGLDDAADEVRRVSRTVSRAWQQREE